MRISIWWTALVLTLVIHTGCSFSYSSKSSSDSSKSSYGSSKSSSDSLASSSGSVRGSENNYKRDVGDYTAAWVKSGGQLDAFQKKLGGLAKQYGITNWEDNEATYLGIGQGLADAKVSQVQFESYRDNLARSDPTKMKAIQKGYDSRK